MSALPLLPRQGSVGALALNYPKSIPTLRLLIRLLLPTTQKSRIASHT